MSVARKQYTPDERREIQRLSTEGYTQKQIADKIRPGVPSAWRSVGEILRSSRAETKVVEPQASGMSTAPLVSFSPKMSTLQLPNELQGSITAKEIMSMLDDEARELFLATYKDLKGEADEETLTKAENEMLMRASLAHTQYLRAARMFHQCESFLIMELNGKLPDKDDPRKRMAGRGDAYKKEMQDKHREYMELIDGLKLKRSQRLDKIKDTRNTFLDLQTELQSKIRQESIVEDIKKINMATKDEFLRMGRGEMGPDGKTHPWLIGAFEEILKKPQAPAPDISQIDPDKLRESLKDGEAVKITVQNGEQVHTPTKLPNETAN